MNTNKYILNDKQLNPLVCFQQPEDFSIPTFKNFPYKKAIILLNDYCCDVVDCMMDLCNKKYKHFLIDIKVHYLNPSDETANGLWHLDSSLNPVDEYENFLFVSGNHALTEFVCNKIEIPHQNNARSFNTFINQVPNKTVKRIESCTVTRYNGRNVHRGPVSTGYEKRLLIRLVNTNKRLPTYMIGE